jgi:hypothetical protein
MLTSHNGGPVSRPDSMWCVMDEAALGQVFSGYFGFPCQSFLHYHNHPELVQ